MKWKKCLQLATVACILAIPVLVTSGEVKDDWGLKQQQELEDNSEQLFGITKPLTASAVGPYTGTDNARSVVAAKHLSVSVIFDASGTTAYVNIQHRSTNQGAVLKITGFKVK